MLRAFSKKRGQFFEKEPCFKPDGLQWIDCESPNSDEIAFLSKLTGLPESRLGEYTQKEPRPHLVNSPELLIVTIAVPHQSRGTISRSAITFFLRDKTTVVSLRSTNITTISAIEEEMRRSPDNFSSASSFLYAFFHDSIEQAFFLLDEFDDQLLFLENASSVHPTPVVMRRNYELKRDLISLHKTLIANREVLVSLEGCRPRQIADISHYRFLYNDLGQVIEVTDTYREVLTDIIEIYLTAIDTSLNETVKKLTAWGSLILIPTFIASIYGMNFDGGPFNLPELHWKFGYFYALGLMIVSVAIMLVYFKKKRWL